MKQFPEIIAEIGVNYYEIAQKTGIPLVEAAKLMVKKAADAGVKVVKFQTYKAEKLAALNSPAYWDLTEEPTTSQRKLFSKYDKLDFNDYLNIRSYCEELGTEFMATSFDCERAEAINKLVKRHKIASADITNMELLSLIGSYKKPVILSVGASTREEIQKALAILRNCGTTDITLLHCVLNYPTKQDKANLWKISAIKEEFHNVRVGYSDHSKFNKDVLVAAWLLGAEVIEKHFTLDKTLKGNDHYHSATPKDLALIFRLFERIRKIIGDNNGQWYDASENISRKNARRGVYLKKDVKAGDFIKADDVDFLRPQGEGLTPMEWIEKVSRQERYTKDIRKGAQVV